MNKYQEALSRIERFSNYWNNTERVNNNLEPHFNILQELVEKETSRKVSKNLFGRLACDNCGISFQELGQQTYCKHCGQKIDWSSEDE